jgi:hypothetical protein
LELNGDLQDALCTSFESMLVPAFEQSCKTMFEQVDGAFQKGMSEHTVAIQQQVEAAHTPLALTLKVSWYIFCILVCEITIHPFYCPLINFLCCISILLDIPGNHQFCIIYHPEFLIGVAGRPTQVIVICCFWEC